MQIVIDIPEDTLKRTVFYREFRNLNDLVTVIKALEKATPLPKGHGRLIDADDLIKRTKKFIDVPNNYISQRNKDFVYYLEREEAILPADNATNGTE